MSSGDNTAEIRTVAGHPKVQTVGGMRVTGKVDGGEKKTEEVDTSVDSSVAIKDKANLVIAGAMTNEQKDYPTDAVKHMQQKPAPAKEPKHQHQNSQQNRNIHQPR